MNTIFEIGSLVIISIGILFYFIKIYLHFKYIKIIRGIPKKLNFLNYLFKIEFTIRNFIDLYEIVLPFLIYRKKREFSKDEILQLKKLEKQIYFSILMFVIGIITLVIMVNKSGNITSV